MTTSEKRTLQYFIEYPDAICEQGTPLPDAMAEQLKDHYESQADTLLWQATKASAQYAERILCLAALQDNTAYRALGMMKVGNTKMTYDSADEAWAQLQAAGVLFREIGDDVGWARTRIPLLPVSVQINRFTELDADVAEAASILKNAQFYQRLMVLKMNLGIARSRLGDHQGAIEAQNEAIEVGETYDVGAYYIGGILNNLGVEYTRLGMFTEAYDYYQQSAKAYEDLDQARGVLVAQNNIADVVIAQGQYKEALRLLREIIDERVANEIPDGDSIFLIARTTLMKVYLYLNRLDEARLVAQQVIAGANGGYAAWDYGEMFLYLAQIEAKREDYQAAEATLTQARAYFKERDAQSWLAQVAMSRAHVAYEQGHYDEAQGAIADAVQLFEMGSLHHALNHSRLLQARLLLDNKKNYTEAYHATCEVLAFARRYKLTNLHYKAHVLAGTIREKMNDTVRATRHYFAAFMTMERALHGLTITLRNDFLADKQDATHRLMRLLLAANRTRDAFDLLERAKAQHWLSHLMHHDQLQWDLTNNTVHAQVTKLNTLRAQYQGYQHLAQEQPTDDANISGISLEELSKKLTATEAQIRHVIEGLYLQTGQAPVYLSQAVNYTQVQQVLPDNSALISYYHNGKTLSAFLVTKNDDAPLHITLPFDVPTLKQVVGKLHRNFNRALEPSLMTSAQQVLTKQAKKLLNSLYNGVMSPLLSEISDVEQLYIVPYGDLHIVPFHLLGDGLYYLMRDKRIVILPLALYLTREKAPARAGARILADSWGGRLPATHDEAHAIQNLIGGTTHIEEEAQATCLDAQPCQILHIATHSISRLDAPHLSWIQLHDERLYFDDLLQHDMRYDLVTLSACKTGQANISSSEDAIGLGRNLLYAGAGAIVTSLCRVPDSVTTQLMQEFYTGLKAGLPKSIALQRAQHSMLHRNPRAHPVYWGTFQLIGDDRPLVLE